MQTQARSRKNHAAIAMIAVGAAGLLLCVALCASTTRVNERVMLPLTIGTSVLAGWTVIFLSHAIYGAAKSAIRHEQAMAEGERTELKGRFEKTGEVYRVRNGVTVRRVKAFSDGRETILSVYEAVADALPDAFLGTAEIVHGFIVAYEVNADA